ncbi:hypothetical protein SAMN05421780_101385 [Flexibacter flexilis DSM 6793]|uniref:Uncharacterized protein n=1 Tax=Flexibacter flexilis DSM 6793 TaxID=927664 RepID=A0A1I1DR49_9BACT|nr:hypothetical protein SAMN05421780_101385 [Flexibacter flexilis DSM 6793]
MTKVLIIGASGSIAAFVATIVQNPALHLNQNLGISKP